ncbi:acyl-CoA thioesterase [Candidatus Coxiella mudrowiae]|uniref:acyl-CoA thioesterase n=1 Tax=Candidatus Coxiella mudrowiae TaxID=2054173 RepID=UPI001FD51317|nr:hypothetical protein [Candidatus Coxiella mudrowiae]
MKKTLFTWQLKVRDYELDSQGIVNHAIFLYYFNQCRNDYVRSVGIDFYKFHLKGYDF